MSQVVSRAPIRTRLLAGFGALMVLLAAAGIVGWRSMNALSRGIRASMHGVEQDARLSTALATDVAREVAVAARYIEGADPAAVASFDSLRWQTHATHRALRRREANAADKLKLVGIDQALSDAEVRYVLARRLTELGRLAEARAQADSAHAIEAAMIGDLQRLGDEKARRLAQSATALEEAAGDRAFWLVALLVGALAVAAGVVVWVVRSISGPLDQLAAHAERLSEGDLTARSSGRHPGELGLLAEAMNRTSASLSRIGAGAATAADSITRSADDLSAISQQLAAAVGEVTRSMAHVSEGAAGQVDQLRRVDETLRTMLSRAQRVVAEVRQVSGLAAEIEEVARARRSETARTVDTLLKIKGTVLEAAAETRALHDAVADVRGFVATVNQIAEQTNLLGLNAAIEAARAGAEGHGFAVVADEVRKLAGQARAGAERSATITRTITDRVERTARAMQASSEHVDEIERVSHEIDVALRTILEAAERTRVAAESVTTEADANAAAAVDAAGGLAAVAETAEVHAATAEQVRAATAEQEAACVLVTDATRRLTGSAGELRELVGNLRVGEHPAPSSPLASPWDGPEEPSAEELLGRAGKRRERVAAGVG